MGWERGEPRHGCRRGLDRHRDGRQGLAPVAQGLNGHAVGTVVAARHGDRGCGVNHAAVVHVRPGCRQLVVQRVAGRHGLHGGERQAPWDFVLSGDDVLDGKRVLEGGRLGNSEVVGGHLGQVCAGGRQRAQSEFGLLLEVVRSIRLLGGDQSVRGGQHLKPFPAS